MKRFVLFSFAAVCLTFGAFAQKQPAPTSPTLPISPQVKKGKLPNGITYYIRKNTEPKNRAELRLVVNAGSILEDPNQVGLAHFTEHMSFNLGNALKYIWRCDLKKDAVEDLRKARWYIDRELLKRTSVDHEQECGK